MTEVRGTVLGGLACGLILVATAGPVRADIIPLTSPSQFSGGETLLTFEGVQPFENVTRFGGVGFQLVGAPPGTGPSGAFSPTPPREFGPQERTILVTNFEPAGQPARDIQITFPGAVNRLGFELTNGAVTSGDVTVTLLAGGTTVGSLTLPFRGPSMFFFYGLESTVAFDQAVLRGPGPNDRRVSLDNLRFESAAPAVVPEPSVLTFLGLGTFGLLGWGWRRHRRAA